MLYIRILINGKRLSNKKFFFMSGECEHDH